MKNSTLLLIIVLLSSLSTCQDRDSVFCIYETYPSGLRDYKTRIDLSHFLPSSEKNAGTFFDNQQREMILASEKTNSKLERIETITIVPSDETQRTRVAVRRRVTTSIISKKKKPRVLVIGDSVTSGYGSNSNKKKFWLPGQYWAFAKMLFEMEKIDNGDKHDEYNSLFLGVNSSGDFTIDYEGVSRMVRARAEGYGGASLQQLFEPVLGNEKKPNPFYDKESGTFSLLSYLSKYRTMDDQGERLLTTSHNPAGERVIGSDGKVYYVGTEIQSQSKLLSVDVCTPSIVVINLCHNTTFENYKNNIGEIVNVLHKDLPETKIVIMTIDETGTLFPADYPEYAACNIVYTSLHDKNMKIYKYLKEKVENEKEGVYLLAAQFVMPTVEGIPTIENKGKIEKNPAVIGPNYHPNNRVHEVWGYALYSMIKYLITDK